MVTIVRSIERSDDTTAADEDRYLSTVEIWRWMAVVSVVATVGTITLMANADPCSRLTSIGLFLAWIVAPAFGIASLFVASVVDTTRIERLISGGLASLLFLGWAYALTWSSVGVGIDQIGC